MATENKQYVVGIKQTIKAIMQQKVKRCFVAKDAEQQLIDNIIELCNKNGVKVIYLDTMRELGHKFKIAVGAATAAELK